MAALHAVPQGTFLAFLQVAGVVLTLELSILAIYFAAISGMFTGTAQMLIAVFAWFVGIFLAGSGIVADSRLTAGQELGEYLNWYLSTGLYLAPLVMVALIAVVVMSDPVLQQKIIERDKVKAEVSALKAEHASKKMTYTIQLEAQKQAALYAMEMYQSAAVQNELKEYARQQFIAMMRNQGINVDRLPINVTPIQSDEQDNDSIPTVETFVEKEDGNGVASRPLVQNIKIGGDDSFLAEAG